MMLSKLTKNRGLCERITWKDLDESALRTLVRLAKDEDLRGDGFERRLNRGIDVTTRALVGNQHQSARLVVRKPIRLAGLPLVQLILDTYGQGGRFKAAAKDGDSVPAGAVVGTLSGPANLLLTAERVILNFLQHLCGIATQTASYVAALGDSDTRLLDTRKTTPGHRALEKYAVACGGAWNHRMGLYDRVLIKDNHLAASRASRGQALADAVGLARRKNPKLLIEVEVDELDQIDPVLDAGADIILLDNFSVPQLKKAIRQIGGRAATEASGGVSLKALPRLGSIGLDFISCGALVHQSTWVDIGLDWD